ncbi:hypothetical protein EVAR_83525_1 [Eumeta japonica]|uniref:Uncharacterized protein n=1 Tax=Eumeta variegata TaxID=151549 RepID=A0A4C1ZET1_EUMVA|nr:hypothetical protein EVAR_83525_1 [Eumeta japonica]
MELEGGHRNSVIKRRNPIEFGLVEVILLLVRLDESEFVSCARTNDMMKGGQRNRKSRTMKEIENGTRVENNYRIGIRIKSVTGADIKISTVTRKQERDWEWQQGTAQMIWECIAAYVKYHRIRRKRHLCAMRYDVNAMVHERNYELFSEVCITNPTKTPSFAEQLPLRGYEIKVEEPARIGEVLSNGAKPTWLVRSGANECIYMPELGRVRVAGHEMGTV